MAKKEAKEKPLEKMTAKELRELAMSLEGITGASGMNKAELVSAIRKARGIQEPVGRKKSGSIREMKHKMKELKAQREAALKEENEKMAAILRKRILRLKKKTRRVA